MEFSDVVFTRRSIRRFESREVPPELVEQVISAGMSAPSAGNQRPWHFVLVTSREVLDKIPETQPYAGMTKEAPVAIVLCADPNGVRWPDFWPQDLSACAQTMLLAARNLGLGGVWVGVYPLEDRMAGLRALLGIPQDVEPFAILPLGWPADEFKRVDRTQPERIHRERW